METTERLLAEMHDKLHQLEKLIYEIEAIIVQNNRKNRVDNDNAGA